MNNGDQPVFTTSVSSLSPEKKAKYKMLSRKVDQAYERRHIRPNYYRNKLAEMKAFCNENDLLHSKYLKLES